MPNPSTTPHSTPILDAALTYLDRGFSVIPVRSIDKKPFFEWKEFQRRHPSEDELYAWWEKYPNANVAIICGEISGVFCVDADGPDGINWMTNHLPPTSVYSITGKGLHAIYRTPSGSVVVRNKVRLAPQVDIRGEGGYFVAPPSIHASGHIYKWQFTLKGWDDLPEYVPPTAGLGNLSIDLSKSNSSPITAPVSQGSRNSTLAQLAGKWIGAGLDDWEVGHLSMAWNSGNSPPLGEKELSRTIESIRKTHLRNHPENISISHTDLEADYQASLFKPMPESVLNPGGILQGLMEWIDQSSAVSSPIYNLAAVIPTIGSLIGHKYQTETGLKTNFYCIALGYAGSGKDSPQNSIPKILTASTATDVIGPNIITSDSALLRYVRSIQKASTVMFLDEIGMVLKALKRPNSSAFEVPAMLMKLFSGVNRGYLKPYASGLDLWVPWHHVGFYGASTPSHFWDGFTRSEASDGFLARILIFESRHERVQARKSVADSIPIDLVKAIDSLWRVDHGKTGGDLVQQPVAKTIPLATESRSILGSWEITIIDKQNAIQGRDEGVAAIHGRAPEHAAKLALLHSVSLCGPNVESVGVESVRWAIDLMDYELSHICNQIKDNIAENEWHGEQQKIIRAIKKHATQTRPGATIREIQRAGVKVPPKTLEALIGSLMSSGDIISLQHKPNRGFDVTIYAMAKDKSSQETLKSSSRHGPYDDFVTTLS